MLKTLRSELESLGWLIRMLTLGAVAGAVYRELRLPPEERTWRMQALRWQQNQKFNPPSLGPVTWSDYRKAGWIRTLKTFHYSLRDPIEAKLSGVACPTLVVRGTKDPICRQDWAEFVARRLPRGRLAVIPDVAHTLCYTAPGPLAEVTSAFLDDVQATRPPLEEQSSRLTCGSEAERRYGLANPEPGGGACVGPGHPVPGFPAGRGDPR